ncbi:putative ferric reductase [Clavibacter michiganensis]|uniref:ferredoxin reductase family protein n=1 Tax=Clavibacter michiganensis TaxID=28447 RepID=UPI001AE3C018|nr:ferredoxin reductase family protein [Clavibacter michiganensis]MBP2456670.1 putative ferric reductase [Clavibacter michiganensis]MDQ0409240.1 putative ferric reductase [Clavibacter michiganensis]
MTTTTPHPAEAIRPAAVPPAGAPSSATQDHRIHATARRRHARRALAAAAWLSALVAVVLWATSDAARVTGDGRILIVLGIVAGLVGTDLILVMLVLAARVPLIDRLVGHDAAMSLHARLGKPALYLLLAHGALLVVGYSLDSGTGIATMAAELWAAGDVRLGILALALLVVVVVSSVVAVRKLLPYEAWHGIHLLSYAAVVLAVPHQLQEGQVLAESTWQRVYWIALYALALGSVATFRFGRPIVRSLRHRVVVERVEPVGDGVVSLHLRGRDLRRLRARGGQFLMWRFWSAGVWWHAHPLSLSAAPTDTTLRLTVRALGRGSAGLGRLEPGTPVSFEGPYGVFTDVSRTRERVAVVASGIGITPIRAFLEELDVPAGAVTILLRARDPRETYLWDEVVEWAAARGHRVFTSIGPRGSGRAGWLSAADVERGVHAGTAFPDLRGSDLYVCGPQRWADLVVADATAAGLPAAQLHRERFSW